ncbi:GDP-mannose 4,6-dehydratase [Patescibacteria group bacterium]|nr:GDP-mannose 4,6-dehydratase [Patescibacteria group bacterium]
MKRAFITGVLGFVGAHLAKKLLEKGYDVIGLCYHHRPLTTLNLLGLDNKITRIYGNVCDRELIKKVLVNYDIDNIYHLAGITIVSKALRDPLNTFKTNCIGTATLLDVCRDFKNISSILIGSTDKIYGEGLGKTEDDVLNAKGIYETSKICLDYIARSFYHIYKLPITIARTCNIYGEYDLNKRIIPNTIKALKNNQQPVIFKDDKSMREYIYVDDACDAYIILSENIKRSKGEVFNIGSEEVATQDEIVMRLIDISAGHIAPKFVKKPEIFEIYQQTIDFDKIKKTFNWRPSYSLDRGLRRTWERWKF